MKMKSIKNKFRDKLEKTRDFVITFELIPGHESHGRTLEKVMNFAKQAAAGGLLDALTLADNPGGFPSLSPDVIGKEISNLGISPIVHLACADTNRFGLYSRLQQLNRMELRNLLVLTGDYPTGRLSSMAKPGFDLDSVSLLCLLKKMNFGYEPFCMNHRTEKSENTDFYLGAAVSCSKATEPEQIIQYYKLVKKIENGAQFIITQLCCDARKFHELLLFLKSIREDVPVIGSVYILTERIAHYLNKKNVPGVFISDQLYKKIAEESKAPDKGRAAAVERTARLLAVLKGMGYRGAHIGGTPDYKKVREIIKRFKTIRDDWKSFIPDFDFPYKNGFYLYQYDPSTGLNSSKPSKRSRKSILRAVSFYNFESFQKILFNKDIFYFKILKRSAEFIHKYRLLDILFSKFEHIIKALLFNCRQCGDCVLSEMAFVCPESNCPKGMRNGSCGGNDLRYCEVYPDKICAWVRVYEILKSVNRTDDLKKWCIPPRNWALDQTSSWVNFYLNLDNHKIDKRQCQKIK